MGNCLLNVCDTNDLNTPWDLPIHSRSGSHWMRKSNNELQICREIDLCYMDLEQNTLEYILLSDSNRYIEISMTHIK